MLRILIASVLIMIHPADAAENYQIVSLFKSDVFAPYVQIPFRISGADNIPRASLSAKLADDTDKVCDIMQDPFIASNFLLRCSSAANVKIIFEIRDAGISKITYGPIAIKDLGDLVLVDDENPVVDQQVLIGKSLFSSNCMACHQATQVRDSSSTLIRAMIGAQVEMKIPVLQSLTSQQIEYIATYLRNLESP